MVKPIIAAGCAALPVMLLALATNQTPAAMADAVNFTTAVSTNWRVRSLPGSGFVFSMWHTGRGWGSQGTGGSDAKRAAGQWL